MKRIRIVGLVLLIGIISTSYSATLYVSIDGSAVAPYSSWTTGATTIQDAVNIATNTGDIVMVTNGVYVSGAHTTPGYSILNRVVVTNNITLQSVNGPENTLIVGMGPAGSNAVRCIYMSAGTLSGFTLTNGHNWTSGNSVYDQSGGGLFLDEGGAATNCIFSGNISESSGGGAYGYQGGSLTQSIFINNSALYGGGVCFDYAGDLTHCSFSSNSAQYGGGVYCYEGGTASQSTFIGNSADYGGGGYAEDTGSLITQCVFSNNTAILGGGGASCYAAGTITQCSFMNNDSSDDGGGVYLEYGGTVSNSIFSNNAASDAGGGGGGGAFCFEGGTITHCTFTGNTANDGAGAFCDQGGEIYHSLFTGNSAIEDGGGVNTYSGGTVANCTLRGNDAKEGGGVYCVYGGTIDNCIVWSNAASKLPPNNGNDIRDGYSSVIRHVCASDGVVEGIEGCTTNNPQFINAVNLRLQITSPCIDTGINTSVVGTTDLDNMPRIIDGNFDTTNTVDMGTYEYDPATTDSDGDAATDYAEHVADTDAINSNDWFRIAGISNGVNTEVYFDSSTNRLYRLLWHTNLVDGVWSPVTDPRAGLGLGDSMQGTNSAAPTGFYKVQVELP